MSDLCTVLFDKSYAFVHPIVLHVQIPAQVLRVFLFFQVLITNNAFLKQIFHQSNGITLKLLGKPPVLTNIVLKIFCTVIDKPGLFLREHNIEKGRSLGNFYIKLSFPPKCGYS